MLSPGDRNLKEIASNPSSPPSLLTELSNHSDLEIRSLVASNPNTPQDILMRLGEEFPDEIIENPVFNLLTIEEPNSRFVRLSLARSTKTDPEVLARLAATEKEDEKICCAIAKNINTPIDTLKKLVGWRATEDDGDYPYVAVTREILNNPNMPISYLEELLDRYIDSGWDYLLMEFSKLSTLSSGMIEKLAEKYRTDRLLIVHPLTQKSPKLLDKIARHSTNESVLIKIIENPLTLDSTVEYLAAYRSRAVRNLLIDRPNVSQKALDIVLFMQGKPGTPIDLLNELAEDFECHNLELLTKYPYTPREIIEKIVNYQYCTDKDYLTGHCIKYEYPLDIRNIRENIARHPNTSFEILSKLAQKIANYGFRGDKDTLSIVNKRLSNQYIIPVKTEAEPQTIDYRYSRENLFERIPEYKIPF